jgi:hypothetical protein
MAKRIAEAVAGKKRPELAEASENQHFVSRIGMLLDALLRKTH